MTNKYTNFSNYAHHLVTVTLCITLATLISTNFDYYIIMLFTCLLVYMVYDYLVIVTILYIVYMVIYFIVTINLTQYSSH